MAVLMTIEFEASKDQYDEVNQKLDVESNPPDGLLIHAAEDVGGGKMRVVDVWESAGQLEAFTNGPLMAAMTEVMGEQDPDSANPPEVRELHNVVKP
jgi:quinol monooxygenase YgiN